MKRLFSLRFPLCRWLPALLAVSLLTPALLNGEEEDFPPCHQLTRKGIERLDLRLGVKFDIPFPKEADIDFWQKQPIAAIPVTGGTVYANRPFVNPWDGCGTITWMLNRKVESMWGDALDVTLFLDEAGEFDGLSIQRSAGNSWEAGDDTSPQLGRDDSAGETGAAFFNRAMKTFRGRVKQAEDPAEMLRWLEAVEKMARAIQSLRKEEGERAGAVAAAPAEADEEPKETAASQKVTKRAMEHLGEKLDATFNIEPGEIPGLKKAELQPVAKISAGGETFFTTRPAAINSAGTLRWILGKDMQTLKAWGRAAFDAKGELVEICFIEGNDWSFDLETHEAQISREKGEDVEAFIGRGIRTYQERVPRSSKLEYSKRCLVVFEKILRAMQEVRTEEQGRLQER